MFEKLAKELQNRGGAAKTDYTTRISDVNATYFDLVQQQQQLNALDSTIVISNQRQKSFYHRKSF
jgi:hypothetical protein